MNWIVVVVLASIVFVPLLVLWGCYNGLVERRNMAQQSLSGITVQLKRRTDLIPNLVEVVRGYAQHERSLLERITHLRDLALGSSATLPKTSGHTDAFSLQEVRGHQSTAVGGLIAIAESYPDLKASTNYLKLQEQLAETEDQIAAARRIYNANVADYNTVTEQFPANLVAHRFAFTRLAFFTDETATHPVPSVSGVARAS
jgi:LemA protein